MRLPFQFSTLAGEVSASINYRIASNANVWTWLHTSSTRPVRLEPSEWPPGLSKSVDIRNQARHGEQKGRVLIVREGPTGEPEKLRPVAVLCWHVHQGNWPLAVLDMGYRTDLDAAHGQRLVEGLLLPALCVLNDHETFKDTGVARPTDVIGWAVRRQEGAGSDSSWARQVAARAQQDWSFARVEKRLRPSWAQEGFYGERRRSSFN